MPVRLVGERVDVDATRSDDARQPLPPAITVGVRYRDLKAVWWKPSRVIQIVVAIASTSAWPFRDNLTGA